MNMTATQILASIRAAAVSNVYPIPDDAAFFSNPHMANMEGEAVVALRERILVERAIIRCVVKDALSIKVEGGHAYVLNVYDGEEVVIQDCRDLDQIMGALMSTDQDALIVRRVHEGRASTYVGHIDLIYGNSGWEVIADHSDNGIIEDIVSKAQALADELCELMQ